MLKRLKEMKYLTIFIPNNDNNKKVCYINTMPCFEDIFKNVAAG
jgi:hypothetical protein